MIPLASKRLRQTVGSDLCTSWWKIGHGRVTTLNSLSGGKSTLPRTDHIRTGH